MIYLILKSVHIIFMVSYFAGIFYLVRLFVYWRDTEKRAESEQVILRDQFLLMIRRLWNIIIVPAGSIMLITGIWMIFLNPVLLDLNWFWIKIFFLIGLLFFHAWCFFTIRQTKLKNLKKSSVFYRMMNEVATIILFGVVFVVILKGAILEIWRQLLIAFIVLVLLIIAIVKWVNRAKK